MNIRFTYVEIAPIVARLQARKPEHRPTAYTPERWEKLLAGKVAQLSFQELDGIAVRFGWETVDDLTKDIPGPQRRGKK